jgi:hypothetical protein
MTWNRGAFRVLVAVFAASVVGWLGCGDSEPSSIGSGSDGGVTVDAGGPGSSDAASDTGANGDAGPGDAGSDATLPKTSLKDGESCNGDTECAGGYCKDKICALAPATGAPDCMPQGEPCDGAKTCGDVCCSKTCSGDRCQALDGCRIGGELCRKDADCCGGDAGTTCSIEGDRTFGRCRKGAGCLNAGKLCSPTLACGVNKDCCRPLDGQPEDFCTKDRLGVYRCRIAAACHNVGDVCASSADCCALNPCVDGQCKAP